MKKCEVIEDFSLNEFDKLKNIKRKSLDVKGKLFVEDVFECDDKMANYLLGDNPLERQVVKVIETEDNKTNVYKKEEICYNKSNKKRDKKKDVE